MKWKFRPWPQATELYPLVRELGIPPLAAAVFWNRGFRSKADLEPPLTLLPIQGLREAALRILEAIHRKERIRVHGDYDADGLTGTAILLKGLSRLGAEIHAFIPHRLDEGYGVLMERVPEHLEACDLFVTVDCGITNHAELSRLVDRGISVIVTDHHTPGATLPPGLIVHPALSPTDDPLRDRGVTPPVHRGDDPLRDRGVTPPVHRGDDPLRDRGTPSPVHRGDQPHPTGAGVAFLLLWQVYELLGQAPPLEYADLAAIGTVADLAPLQGFNRALVQEGLRRLQNSAHPGLRVLAEEHCRAFSAGEIAFRIAPRINAASRLGQAEVALQLLTTPDLLEAQACAQELSRLNQERQRIEEEMLARIWPGIDPTHPALVIHDKEGHPGVMGIVASRVLERYYKPVFIIVNGKGSVRSTPGISAVGALQEARTHLKRFGGHAQAAGFAIEEAQIPAFTEAIHRYVARFPPPEPELVLDGWLDGEDLLALYQALQRLEPLGEGNPEPLFYTRGRPERVRPLKEGRHLSFYLNGLRVIRWGRSPSGQMGYAPCSPGGHTGSDPLSEPIEVAGVLALNRWNGEASVELWARAYRPSPVALAGGWAVPVPFSEAVARALAEKARVYVHPEGAAWFTHRGVEVVEPAEAAYWFSLPALPTHPEKVQIALSEKALASLERGQNLQGLKTLARRGYRSLVQALGRRVAAAYRLGLALELGESLEHYWQALQAYPFEAR